MGQPQSQLPDENDQTVYIIFWQPAIAFGHVTHVGVFVFGKLIEYSIEGLEMTSGGQVDKYSKESLGKTSKKVSEFNTWFLQQQKGNFAKDKFDIVNNNCIVFARAMAAFLGVQFSQKALDELEWVRNNPGATRFFAVFGRSVNSFSS